MCVFWLLDSFQCWKCTCTVRVLRWCSAVLTWSWWFQENKSSLMATDSTCVLQIRQTSGFQHVSEETEASSAALMSSDDSSLENGLKQLNLLLGINLLEEKRLCQNNRLTVELSPCSLCTTNCWTQWVKWWLLLMIILWRFESSVWHRTCRRSHQSSWKGSSPLKRSFFMEKMEKVFSCRRAAAAVNMSLRAIYSKHWTS